MKSILPFYYDSLRFFNFCSMISTDLSHSIKTGTTSWRRVANNAANSDEPGILSTDFSHVFASLRMVASRTTTFQSSSPNNGNRHAQTAMSLRTQSSVVFAVPTWILNSSAFQISLVRCAPVFFLPLRLAFGTSASTFLFR